MANNNQTDAEYLVSCMFGKPLSEYTPTELKEYYEEKQAEIEFEEKKIAETEDLDLKDE